MKHHLQAVENTRTGEAPGAAPPSPGDEAAPGTPQTGEAICPRCAGSGLIHDRPCPDCQGSGTITVLVGDA
jgi:hypothetical protein